MDPHEGGHEQLGGHAQPDKPAVIDEETAEVVFNKAYEADLRSQEAQHMAQEVVGEFVDLQRDFGKVERLVHLLVTARTGKRPLDTVAADAGLASLLADASAEQTTEEVPTIAANEQEGDKHNDQQSTVELPAASTEDGQHPNNLNGDKRRRGAVIIATATATAALAIGTALMHGGEEDTPKSMHPAPRPPIAERLDDESFPPLLKSIDGPNKEERTSEKESGKSKDRGSKSDSRNGDNAGDSATNAARRLASTSGATSSLSRQQRTASHQGNTQTAAPVRPAKPVARPKPAPQRPEPVQHVGPQQQAETQPAGGPSLWKDDNPLDADYNVQK